MTFYAFGLNHETAPVATREAFALDADALQALYHALPLSNETELIVLSTCNRTEVYLFGDRADIVTVQRVLAEQAGHPWPEAEAFLAEDEAAILHLFQVTAGLKSMVPGDAQILAQVKEAYRLATSEEQVGTVLHRLMHTAFRTAKRVINETRLTNGTASVPSAAIAMARRHFEAYTPEGLSGCRVVLVGAGQMGRLALETLAAHAVTELAVTNRSRERAEALACVNGAQVVAWADRYAAIAEADLVLVASGAAEPVLRAEMMPPRSDNPMLIIDVAVPRNVEPAVGTLPGYAVVDLDALNVELHRVQEARRAEIPAAERICSEALGEYVAWVFHHQALQPAIQAIRDTFESIRVQEIERHHGRFSDLDRNELDRLTTSIIQKVLAVPVVRLKSVDPDSIDFARGIKLLHALFSRPSCEDESAQPLPAHEVAARASLPTNGLVRCPFEPDETVDPEEQLRAALRLSSRNGSQAE